MCDEQMQLIHKLQRENFKLIERIKLAEQAMNSAFIYSNFTDMTREMGACLLQYTKKYPIRIIKGLEDE